MSSAHPIDWTINRADPRSPGVEAWQRMTALQRAQVDAMLPSKLGIEYGFLPQGDAHSESLFETRWALRRHYGQSGRRIYIAADMAVYYPGERVFSPDVFAVLDIDRHERRSWHVNHEGKGLDLCIEWTWFGSAKKDAVKNLEKYARLGIQEYFVCDVRRGALRGYQLGLEAGTYGPVFPQEGRLWSAVLQLDLAIDRSRLRFYDGDEPVPFASELTDKLRAAERKAAQRAHVEAERARVEAERARAEEKRAKAAEERARVEAERSFQAERRLAEVLLELEELKRR